MLNRKASGDHYKFTINIKNKPKVVCVCTNHQKFDFNTTTMAHPGTKQIAHENQNNRLHTVFRCCDDIPSRYCIFTLCSLLFWFSCAICFVPGCAIVVVLKSNF